MPIEKCSTRRAVCFINFFPMLRNFLTYAFFEDIQNKTKEAIWRIQQQGAEAEGIGNETLQVLRHQGQQMVWGKNINYVYFSLHSSLCFYLLLKG